MILKPKNLVFSIPIAVALLLVSFAAANAQTEQPDKLSFQNRLRAILGNFNNVRFSSVSYYQLKDSKGLKDAIKTRWLTEEDANTGEEDSQQSQVTGVDSARLDSIVAVMRILQARGKSSLRDMRRAFSGEDDDNDYSDMNVDVSGKEFQTAYNIANKKTGEKRDILEMFVITEPRNEQENGEIPNIIALVLYYDRPSEKEDKESRGYIGYYDVAIGGFVNGAKTLITYPELQNTTIPSETSSGYRTLYELLENEFRQDNVTPITAEVRGIGTEWSIFKTYGKSVSMISNENDITDADVARFIRISEGQPIDYAKPNELIVSPDYISYRRYQSATWYDNDYVPYYGAVITLEGGATVKATDSSEVWLDRYMTNDALPQYGVELKYGLDEINYPSFFSEKMMIRAIWDNIKLGLVLPTAGWAGLGKDLFGIDRKFTSGGVGLSAALDFPIKVIPNSGIFSISGSYVFGDASAASYKDRNSIYEEQGYKYVYEDNLYNDFLVRYTAQVHYTFGVTIDRSYQLRLGVGATVYGAERWRDWEAYDSVGNPIDVDEDGITDLYYGKSESEAVGGLSLRLEFMARDITTPFGASVQYFDESLFGNVWLEIPILPQAFFLRLDAKGYVAAFKDTLHPWENRGVLMPSVKLIFNF